jgi:hypothetical protein
METVGLVDGKYSLAIITAKKLYTMKSNHSSALPIVETTITRWPDVRFPCARSADARAGSDTVLIGYSMGKQLRAH